MTKPKYPTFGVGEIVKWEGEPGSFMVSSIAYSKNSQDFFYDLVPYGNIYAVPAAELTSLNVNLSGEQLPDEECDCDG